MSRLRVWAPNWREPACDTVGRRNKLQMVAALALPNKPTTLQTLACNVLFLSQTMRPASVSLLTLIVICHFTKTGVGPLGVRLLIYLVFLPQILAAGARVWQIPFSLSFVDTSSQFWRSRGCRDIFQIDLFDHSQSDGSEQFVKCSVHRPVYVTGLIWKVIGRLCWNEPGRSFCWWQAWFYY